MKVQRNYTSDNHRAYLWRRGKQPPSSSAVCSALDSCTLGTQFNNPNLTINWNLFDYCSLQCSMNQMQQCWPTIVTYFDAKWNIKNSALSCYKNRSNAISLYYDQYRLHIIEADRRKIERAPERQFTIFLAQRRGRRWGPLFCWCLWNLDFFLHLLFGILSHVISSLFLLVVITIDPKVRWQLIPTICHRWHSWSECQP